MKKWWNMLRAKTFITSRDFFARTAAAKSCYCTFVDWPSALYVPQNATGTNFSPANPYYDFENFENNRDLVQDMLEKRKLSFDLEGLMCNILKYKEFISSKNTLKKDIRMVKSNIDKRLNKYSVDGIKILATLNKELASLVAEKGDSDHFLHTYLKIPALLHHSVELEDLDMCSELEPPSFTFKPKSHLDIGHLSGDIEMKDVGPGGFFLKGVPSFVEFACSNFFSEVLFQRGFVPFSSQDFGKAPLVEGCGMDPHDLSKGFRVKDKDCSSTNNYQYLTGSASISAFVSIVSKRYLRNIRKPVNMATCGRIYQPIANESVSLFNTSQSLCVTALSTHLPSSAEEIRQMVLQLVMETYSQLNVHFKIVNVGAPKLHSFETMAYSIIMFNTTANNYVEVGRVSFCGDYISKRLETTFKNNPDVTFAEMVYIKLIDITKFIGCLIENAQMADGSFLVPSCLKDHMMIDCNYVD